MLSELEIMVWKLFTTKFRWMAVEPRMNSRQVKGGFLFLLGGAKE